MSPPHLAWRHISQHEGFFSVSRGELFVKHVQDEADIAFGIQIMSDTAIVILGRYSSAVNVPQSLWQPDRGLASLSADFAVAQFFRELGRIKLLDRDALFQSMAIIFTKNIRPIFNPNQQMISTLMQYFKILGLYVWIYDLGCMSDSPLALQDHRVVIRSVPYGMWQILLDDKLLDLTKCSPSHAVRPAWRARLKIFMSPLLFPFDPPAISEVDRDLFLQIPPTHDIFSTPSSSSTDRAADSTTSDSRGTAEPSLFVGPDDHEPIKQLNKSFYRK